MRQTGHKRQSEPGHFSQMSDIHIYIYAFSRGFYPKRLTVHSYFCQYMYITYLYITIQYIFDFLNVNIIWDSVM